MCVQRLRKSLERERTCQATFVGQKQNIEKSRSVPAQSQTQVEKTAKQCPAFDHE